MSTDPGADAGRANATSGAGDHTQQSTATVMCPKGHVNAWDYRFCGECGSPIGLVAWPSDDSDSPGATPARSRVPLLIGGAALLVIAVVASVAVFVVTRSSGHDPAERGSPWGTASAGAPSPTGPPTCSSVPILEAESIDLESDGLSVSVAFMSSCRGGDTESNSALEVTVADGRRDVAAGSFDFSSEPLTLEPGVPSRRTLIFPPGMYWRTPNMLSGSPQLQAKRTGESAPSSARADSGPATIVAAAPAEPAYGSVDGVAEAVLKELRDSDFSTVRNGLSNRWVPQVSSKRVGLVIDGKTWTNADILRDHLALRQRFSGARLVWSGQWSTFSDPDFWVTVVGPPLPFAEDANRWCDANGFDVNDCFAKFISSLFGVEGTTVYRR
jgi:hypothetical protein